MSDTKILSVVSKLTNPADDPNVVLEAAKDSFSAIVVLGMDNDYNFDIRASLNINYVEVAWLLDKGKQYLLENFEGFEK